jgi:NAD(P)H-dependent FMN reductase
MSVLVVSASLNPDSRSRLLALEARRILTGDGPPPEWLDLGKLVLPLCGPPESFDHPAAARAQAMIAAADGILAATPIYNFDANAALKNLIELTGSAWEDKVVGFLCSAGGASSYMSILSLANSLMLDFRCVIVPRFVYATDDAFADGRLADPRIIARVAECARATARLAAAVKSDAV